MVSLAFAELIVGLLTVAWLAALIWSLVAILTAPEEVWKQSGMSRVLWLAVVVILPIIGSVLFVIVARPRLAPPNER